ncbi:MAG: flagellar hook-length control protein FliK, partial [Pseudomonadota bacterium]
SDRDSKSSDSTARDTSSGNNLPTDRLDNAASSENSDNTSSDDYKTAASGNDTDVRDARQAESEQGYTSATSQKPDKNPAPGQRTDGRSSGLVKAAGLPLGSLGSGEANPTLTSALQAQTDASSVASSRDNTQALVSGSAKALTNVVDATLQSDGDAPLRNGALQSRDGLSGSAAKGSTGDIAPGIATDSALDAEADLAAQKLSSSSLPNGLPDGEAEGLPTTRNAQSSPATSAFAQREAIVGKEAKVAGSELSTRAARSSLLDPDPLETASTRLTNADTAALVDTSSSVSTRAVDAALSTQNSLTGSTAAASPLQTLGNASASVPTSTSATGSVPEFVLQQTATEGEFAEEVAGRMQMLMRDGVKEARLQLNPAELGRLLVTISTDGDQARVAFLAESAGAREMIEQSLPKLRDMLEQQGLQLAHSDVGEQGAFAQREESGSDQHTLAAAEALDVVELANGSDENLDPASQPQSLIDTYI